VFVVNAEQKVDLRPVTVGRTTATETVIESGLKPGETVVTDGHLRLVPGSHITVKGQSEQPADAKVGS
jgi:multidrug efflux system membrane fusion protein